MSGELLLFCVRAPAGGARRCSALLSLTHPPDALTLQQAVKVNALGKWKTALQMTSMSMLLFFRDETHTMPAMFGALCCRCFLCLQCVFNVKQRQKTTHAHTCNTPTLTHSPTQCRPHLERRRRRQLCVAAAVGLGGDCDLVAVHVLCQRLDAFCLPCGQDGLKRQGHLHM